MLLLTDSSFRDKCLSEVGIQLAFLKPEKVFLSSHAKLVQDVQAASLGQGPEEALFF